MPLLARALKEVRGLAAGTPELREVFGERDAVLATFLELLRSELLARPRAKLDATAAEIARWETTTTGTDFPAGA